MTIKQIYMKYKEIASSQGLEEEGVKFIIGETCNLSDSEIVLNYDQELSFIQEKVLVDKLNEYIYKLIPPQYIIGHTYFYARKYLVNPSVLIPRFDTEIVVEKALEEINKLQLQKAKVLDVGTGSGCIAITLKKENPSLVVEAVDISEEALEVAIKNAKLNKAKVKFYISDMLSKVKDKYDVIVSNPPYIAIEEEVDEMVSKNEPSIALYAPFEGMEYYKRILEDSSRILKEKNVIIFEIAYNKEDEILELAKQYYPSCKFRIEKDLNGNNRVAIIENN